MKSALILSTLILTILAAGCSNEVTSLDNYEKAILNNTFMRSIPQLQSPDGCSLFKENKIKTISYVVLKNDGSEVDSMTYVELDKDGKMIYRTTKDNVGLGCLPYMHRQKFFYDNDKIKKVLDFTFKYKSNSVIDKWMLKDTSQLNLFDWQDYSYIGDTTTVKTGFGIYKFVKASDGNFIKQTVLAKTNNQLNVFDYEYYGSTILAHLNAPTYDSPIDSKYVVDENRVTVSFRRDNDKFLKEYEYDSDGLIRSEKLYINGKIESITWVTYTYY